MQKRRVMALILAVTFIISPVCTHADTPTTRIESAVADSGTDNEALDSGMKPEPPYYSEEYADYLMQLDYRNLEEGLKTDYWMTYMVKWGKAIPYEEVPDDYVYQKPNTRGRAATITVKDLPLGAKVVDPTTKWGSEPMIWTKCTSSVMIANGQTPATTTYNAPSSYWASTSGRSGPYAQSGAAYFYSEKCIARLPQNTTKTLNAYLDTQLKKWLNEAGQNHFLSQNFYSDVLSKDIKANMQLATMWLSFASRVNDKGRRFEFYQWQDAWVGLPLFPSTITDMYQNVPIQFAAYANLNNLNTAISKHSYYPTVNGTGNARNYNNSASANTGNCVWSYQAGYGVNDYGTDRNSYTTNYLKSSEIGLDITPGELSSNVKPVIALKDSTKVYATPDGNGIYTMVTSDYCETPLVSQSYSAATNKATITATSTGALTMQILSGGTVVATASGSSITYQAGANGTYVAKGICGSVSATASITVSSIDELAPTVTYTALPGGWATSKSTTITLADAKTPSGMQYQIGSGAWTSYSAPFAYSFTSTAAITVRGRDKWGNTSAYTTITPANIDRTAPTVPKIAKSPAAAWHNANVTVTLSGSTDTGGSGVSYYQYRIGSGTWTTGASASVASSSTVYGRAVDAVGNISGECSIAVSIEKNAPSGTVRPSTTAWAQSVSLAFSANDIGGSGVKQVRISGGTWVAGSTVSQAAAANGTYRFDAMDNAGNTATISHVVSNIDTAKPSIQSITLTPTGSGLLRTVMGNKQIEIGITAADTGGSGIAKIEYQFVAAGSSVNSGAWLLYNNSTKPRISCRSNGRVYARCTDVAGNVSVVSQSDTALVEDTPPTASYSLDISAWTNQPVTITVQAQDDLSGVASITLPDGTSVPQSTARFTVRANGTYRFTVADKCGNQYVLSVPVTNIENTPPTASHALSPAAWTNQPVRISVTGADTGGSGFKAFTLPNGTVTAGSSAAYTVATNGSYNFSLVDNAGNSGTYRVTVGNIDKLSPNITGITFAKTSDSLLRSTLSSKQVEISITAEDTGGSGIAKIEYQFVAAGSSVNNGAWLPYNNAARPRIARRANGSVYARCTDAAGNSSVTSQSDMVIVEDTPPTASYSLDIPAWTNKPVTITVQAQDDLSGVASITLPDGTVVPQSTARFTVRANGTYRFTVADKCGNQSVLSVPVTNMEFTPPTASHALSPAAWTNQPVRISVTGADTGGSGFKAFTLPDGTVTAGNSAAYTVAANGSYNFSLVDNAGNSGTYRVTVGNIDLAPPEITGISIVPTSDKLRRTVLGRKQMEISIMANDTGGSGVFSIEYQLVPVGSAVAEDAWKPYRDAARPRISTRFHGYVYARCTDVAGSLSAVKQSDLAIVEDTPPTASYSLDISAWTNQPVTITVQAQDDLSGVASITLPDNTLIEQDNAQFTVQTNGTYPFTVLDKCGNQYVLPVLITNIDLTLPTASSILSPSAWTNQPVQISLTGADEGGSGFKAFTLPDGQVVDSGHADYVVPVNGSYDFSLADNAGNQDAYSVEVANIDLIPPEITGITIIQTKANLLRSILSRKQMEIGITANDTGGSGVFSIEYQLVPVGGAVTEDAWKPYRDAARPRISTRFHGYVYARCTDVAGSLSTVEQSDLVTVEDTPPTASYELDIPAWTNQPVTITVQAQDDLSGVASITLPDNTLIEQDNVQFTVQTNGTYPFTVLDKCGNQYVLPVLITNIDLTLPTASSILSPSAWTNQPVQILLTGADEGGSGFKAFTLPDGQVVDSGCADYVVPMNGTYDFSLADNAGNQNAYSVEVANIDPIPPEITGITITQTKANLLRSILSRKQMEISITANDTGGSGIFSIEYQLVPVGGAVTEDAWKPYRDAARPRISTRFHGYVYARCTDVAGSLSTVELSDLVTVEDTPPTASYELDIPAWTNQPVTITVRAQDDLSGVASITLPDGTVVEQDTAQFTVQTNGTYPFTVLDKCGNQYILPVCVTNIEFTPPTASHMLSPAVWTNQPVQILLTGADEGGSGFKAFTLPDGQVVDSGCADYVVPMNGTYDFSLADNAGNQDAYSVEVANIDLIPPEITGITITQTKANLLRSILSRKQMEISITANDTGGSGIFSIEYQLVPVGGAVTEDAWKPYRDTARPRISTRFHGYVYARCTDVAGSLSAVKQSDVAIVEDTPPTASYSLDISAWTNQPVTITVQAQDDLSGVASITLPDGTVVEESSAQFTVQTNGTYPFTVLDKCGNQYVLPVLITNIEFTPPTASHMLSPAVWTNQPVQILLTGADEGGSGFKAFTLPDGTVVDGSEAEFEVAANGDYAFPIVDNAGNRAVYHVTVDTIDRTAPVVTGIRMTESKDNLIVRGLRLLAPGIFAKQVELTLEAEDDYSGIHQIQYQAVPLGGELREEAWQTYQSGRSRLTEDINGKLFVRALDNAGNTSPVLFKTAIVDGTAPTATYTSTPTPDIWTRTFVTLEVTASDATTEVQSITLPDGTVVPGNTASYRIVRNGSYTFTLTDIAGNSGGFTVPVGNIEEFLPTPPKKDLPEDIPENGIPEDFYVPDDMTFEWSNGAQQIDVKALAQSGIEKYEYRVTEQIKPRVPQDASPRMAAGGVDDWETCGGTLLIPEEGIYSVTVRAVSYAGNVSDISTYTVKNDFTPPTASYASSRAGDITITASDNLSGIATIACGCKVRNAQGTIMEESTVVHGTVASCQIKMGRAHTYQITDNAGNVLVVNVPVKRESAPDSKYPEFDFGEEPAEPPITPDSPDWDDSRPQRPAPDSSESTEQKPESKLEHPSTEPQPPTDIRPDSPPVPAAPLPGSSWWEKLRAFFQKLFDWLLAFFRACWEAMIRLLAFLWNWLNSLPFPLNILAGIAVFGLPFVFFFLILFWRKKRKEEEEEEHPKEEVEE